MFLQVSLFLRAHRNASELLSAVGHWGETRPTLDEDTLRIECLPPESEPQGDDGAGSEATSATDGRLIDPDNITPDSLSLYYRCFIIVLTFKGDIRGENC